MSAVGKRIAIVVSALGLIVAAALALVIFQKRSNPTLVCVPTDDGIRPRTYCVLNPFRDRDPEIIAERLLDELKKGNNDALAPYLADRNDDHRNRYLTAEGKYRITAWRNGEIEMIGDELNIQYWVSRANYPVNEEEVRFFFFRTADEWNLRSYTAIY